MSAEAAGGSFESMEGCCVCADDTGTEDNPLVYCDGQGCNVCVHKACYGIRAIPNGDWFCSKCAYLRGSVRPDSSPSGGNNAAGPRIVKCELCPSREGALKPTSQGKWAHVVCALYIKEATFGDTEVMEPILTNQLPKELFQRTCSICLEVASESDASYGACAICEKSGCKKAFHVTCAQKKGLLCEITRKNSKSQVVYSGYCGEHIPSAESGLIDGQRYRKIAAYPRMSGVTVDRASSSSGYSTPNNPDKSPPSQLPESAPPPASTEADNQRSSSIKSTASIGSSGTTESADSGILATSEASAIPSVPTSSSTPAAQPPEEQRAIRKPPKKSLSARMDGAGVSTPAAPASPYTFPSNVPFGNMVPSAAPPPSQPEPVRYYANNPFASQYDMLINYDLSRSYTAPNTAPHPAVHGGGRPVNSSKHGENPLATHQNKLLSQVPPPPPSNTVRKRPLSPSILDNETLTISSLIERTIERATTSTTTMPPVSVPLTTGVRPGYVDDRSNRNHFPNESALKKPKKSAKESKADLKRAGNTATIKDLLASSNLSPQNGNQPSPQPDSMLQPGGPPLVRSKPPTPKPRNAVSVAGSAGFLLEQEGSNQSGSPFPREKPVSPRTMNSVRQIAVEKVQHYLNTNLGTPEAPLERPPSASQPAAPKSKRKPQDERSRASNNGKTGHSQQQHDEPHPPGSSGPTGRDTEESRKVNGCLNGPTTDTSVEDVERSANAQAFDTLMTALSNFGMSAAHQTSANHHPTAATTLDGFFRMHRELTVLKEKVGQLEGLKAFYLTQVQALRSLADKTASDGYPIVQPTMPEEVARLLSVLGEPHEEASVTRQKAAPTSDHASDGLLARLHEPGVRDPVHRSHREPRPESRPQTSTSTGPPSVTQQNSAPQSHMQAPSPSHTPKSAPRSRASRDAERERERDREVRERDRDRDREREVSNNNNNNNYGYPTSRRGHYQHLENMDGIPSGVISTPTPAVSAPQLLMPNVAGTPFILPNQQIYNMQMDPQRMMAMFPGHAFFPSSALYGNAMAGFIPAPSPSDYTGIGRMHTPTTSRYPGEENHSGGTQHQHSHSSMKREYEARDTN